MWYNIIATERLFRNYSAIDLVHVFVLQVESLDGKYKEAQLRRADVTN